MATIVSKKARSYVNGKPLSADFRQAVCDDLISNGVEQGNVHFPGLHRLAQQTADKFRITRQSVVKYWTQMCTEGNVNPKKQGGPHTEKKLSDQALALIELYITEDPSITTKAVKQKLVESGVIQQDEVCETTVYRAIKKRLSSELSLKRCSINNIRRFTPDNLAYTQAYIDELYTRDAHHLKFFDESGFCPTSNHPKYGWSEKGVRCVDVKRYAQNPHFTLNLMIGTEGVTYANVVLGATDGEQLVEYFGQATQRLNQNGEPFLRNGDIVVMDNCPTHHGRFGRELREYLATRGIELLYTPRYSPEMNPAEFAFSKIKTLLKQGEYRDMYAVNPGYTIYELVKEITVADCLGFFRITNYLNV